MVLFIETRGGFFEGLDGQRDFLGALAILHDPDQAAGLNSRRPPVGDVDVKSGPEGLGVLGKDCEMKAKAMLSLAADKAFAVRGALDPSYGRLSLAACGGAAAKQCDTECEQPEHSRHGEPDEDDDTARLRLLGYVGVVTWGIHTTSIADLAAGAFALNPKRSELGNNPWKMEASPRFWTRL